MLIHHGGELYGSDRVFLQTVRALAALARPVVVIGGSGPLAERIEACGVRPLIRRLGVLRRGNLNPRGVVRTLFEVMGATLQLSRLIREHRVDLVYTNTLAVVSGALAARLTRRPHVWHVHEMIDSPALLKRALKVMMERFSTVVIAVSRAVRSHWLAMQFRWPEKIRVIHNGMATERFDTNRAAGAIRREFSIESGCFFIGVIGRVHYMKGHGTFFEALHLLKQSGLRPFKAVVVGDVFRGYEPLLEQLKGRVWDLDLQNDVIFCGYRTDVAAILHDVDVLVMPSEGPDSFPTVILEAMAAGKPVVATASGGAVELVEDGVTGQVVPAGDSRAMARALEGLAASPQAISAMGRAGRLRLEQHFSEKLFFERLQAEVRSVLQEGLGIDGQMKVAR